jgi:hypothetical protein
MLPQHRLPAMFKAGAESRRQVTFSMRLHIPDSFFVIPLTTIQHKVDPFNDFITFGCKSMPYPRRHPVIALLWCLQRLKRYDRLEHLERTAS